MGTTVTNLLPCDMLTKGQRSAAEGLFPQGLRNAQVERSLAWHGFDIALVIHANPIGMTHLRLIDSHCVSLNAFLTSNHELKADSRLLSGLPNPESPSACPPLPL
jgi:hypothetical protein